MKNVTSKPEPSHPAIESNSHLFDDWFDPIEAGVRDRVRGFIQAMIEGARQRALAWSDTLQNFFCFEVTNHSVDGTGHGDWKHKDTLVELMRYVNHGESRTTLMLNGDRSDVQPDQLQFAHSAGEFGAMFHIVLLPFAIFAANWDSCWCTSDSVPLPMSANPIVDNRTDDRPDSPSASYRSPYSER